MPHFTARNRENGDSVEVPLPDRVATLGRSPRAEIRIDDPSVSKIHARVEPLADGRVRLHDLGSRNGLFVGSERKEQVTLATGDEVRLGNIVLVLAADPGPVVPPASPDALPVEAKPARSGASLLAPVERRLLAVFSLLVIALVVVLWKLPRDEAPDGPGATGAAGVAGVEDPGRADAPGAARPTDSSAGAEPAPATAPPPDPRHDGDGREEWGALGASLDEACSGGGCHGLLASIDFHVTAVPEFGRWERNLATLRAATTLDLEMRGGDPVLVVAPFADAATAPHDGALHVPLEPVAAAGFARLEAARGPLLGADAVGGYRFARVTELAAARTSTLRRAWLLLYGRLPTVEELLAAAPASPDELLATARQRAEFWRARARNALRGHGCFVPAGGWELPGSLLPEEVPQSVVAWARRVTDVRARNATRWPHPYRGEAPLPADDGNDDAFRGWFLHALEDAPRPLPPDVVLASAWVAVWGAQPAPGEARLLSDLVASGLDWRALRRRALPFVVRVPRAPVHAPRAKEAEPWVRGAAQLLLGRALPAGSAAAIAEALADGRLEARDVIQECLTAEEFRHGG